MTALGENHLDGDNMVKSYITKPGKNVSGGGMNRVRGLLEKRRAMVYHVTSHYARQSQRMETG